MCDNLTFIFYLNELNKQGKHMNYFNKYSEEEKI